MRRLVASAALSALLAACSGTVGSSAARDAGVTASRDASALVDATAAADATPALDAPEGLDASAPDAPAAPDAAALDAEAPDAAAPDGGSTRSCAGSRYKLCEDFEGTAEGAVPAGWARVMPYAPNPGAANPREVLVTSDQPHWGSRSLKSTSDSCAQTRIEHPLDTLGATAGRHWGRAFFYVQTPAPMSNRNGGWFHTTMVALRGDNSGGGSARECRVVDMVENAFDQSVGFLYNVPDDSCCDARTVTPYTFRYESVWHCAEWFVDASTNSWRFFLDGTELLSFANNAGARLPQCNVSVAVGALCYAPPLNAPQNFTAWIDDVAIDDNRIGCQ